MGRVRGGGAGGRVGWGGVEWSLIAEEKVWGGEEAEMVGEVGSCIRWNEFMILRNEVTAYESLSFIPN